MSVSKTILIGNLGKDPEVRYLQNGDAVCNFNLATSESWKDKNSGEKVEKTEWHRCVAFKRPAEIIGEFARKGTKMYVEGQNVTRKWQSQSGEDHYTTEIKVRDFQFLSGKPEDKSQDPQSSESFDFDTGGDEIPFS